MNKVVFLKAYFLPVGKNEVVKIPTREKEKRVSRRRVRCHEGGKEMGTDGFSDSIIDTGRLTKDLQETVEKLNKEGYEIVSLTQVISGQYAYDFRSYGYGYSYTDGLMVVARKVERMNSHDN